MTQSFVSPVLRELFDISGKWIIPFSDVSISLLLKYIFEYCHENLGNEER